MTTLKINESSKEHRPVRDRRLSLRRVLWFAAVPVALCILVSLVVLDWLIWASKSGGARFAGSFVQWVGDIDSGPSEYVLCVGYFHSSNPWDKQSFARASLLRVGGTEPVWVVDNGDLGLPFFGVGGAASICDLDGDGFRELAVGFLEKSSRYARDFDQRVAILSGRSGTLIDEIGGVGIGENDWTRTVFGPVRSGGGPCDGMFGIVGDELLLIGRADIALSVSFAGEEWIYGSGAFVWHDGKQNAVVVGGNGVREVVEGEISEWVGVKASSVDAPDRPDSHWVVGVIDETRSALCLYEQIGDAPGLIIENARESAIGAGFSFLNDVDSDGVADVVLLTGDQTVEVRSGISGELVHSLRSRAGSVWSVGDWDSDGTDDYALCFDYWVLGGQSAMVHSGVDGRYLADIPLY